MNTPEIKVGCYYFPNYHTTDERNAQVHGEGWSEWELLKAAIPRFEGHHQPLKPVWGYADEAKPEVMAQKIQAAQSHGIDFFIMDYYHYPDGTFLSHCLDDGLLPAIKGTDFKFALMWANHDWIDIHPRSLWHKPDLLYKGAVDPESFRKITDYIIEHYFKNSNYYCNNGCPYFSIYDLPSLLNGLGGFQATKKALADFRQRVINAGFKGMELNAIVWGRPVLPCEDGSIDMLEGVKELGFDSATSYCWVHHCQFRYDVPQTPYNQILKDYLTKWDDIESKIDIPYYPNVSVGWDPSPRCSITDKWTWRGSYPFSPIISENTPENFENALQTVKERMQKYGNSMLTLYCWNEWTEGSMLEPEEQYGYGYLDALKRVFGKKTPALQNTLPTKEENVIRIASYNIQSGNGMDHTYNVPRTAAAVAKLQADVVGLQEVRIYKDDRKDGNIPQILSDITDMQVHFARAIDFDSFEYGIGALTKCPSQAIGLIDLPNVPGTEQRIALFIKVQHPTGSFYLVNTHLSYESDLQNTRTEQIARILHVIEKNGLYPAILTGDLNAVPTEPCIQLLKNEGWTIADCSQKTCPSDNPRVQIDYIAWSPQNAFKLQKFTCVEDKISSDHYPVVADLIKQ